MISQIDLLNQFDRSFTDEELFHLFRYFRSKKIPLPWHTPDQVKLLKDSKSRVCDILGLFFRATPSKEIRMRLPYLAILQMTDYVLSGRFRSVALGDVKAILANIPRLKAIVEKFQKEFPASLPKKAENQPSSPASRPTVQAIQNKNVGDHKKERKEKLKALAAATPPLPTGLTVSHKRAANIWVSVHAWERFVKRYCHLAKISKPGWYIPEHFANKMRAIFERSVEVQLSNEGVVRRLIDNEFIPVRYFLDSATQLRFVVKESHPVLFTVEIATRK